MIDSRRSSWVLTSALLVPLAALAAWEGMQVRQSPAAHWSVGLSIVAVVGGALVLGRGRQVERSATWCSAAVGAVAGWRRTLLCALGVAVWIVLLAAAVGWDLHSFMRQSHDLPTLSYEIGRVTRWRWGRAVVFAAWLAAGVGLAATCLVPRARQRRRSPQRPPGRP
jgi:hypothetical protein